VSFSTELDSQIMKELKAENAALKERADSLAFELRGMEKLRLKDNKFLISQRDKAVRAAKAYQELNVCYRIDKRPSEKLFDRLRAADEFMDDTIHAREVK
jgi:hypothetical protein